MESSKAREEAERYKDAARELLEGRDLEGSKRLAKKAQETDPTVEGIDQITAIIDVLIASEKRINNHLDWYAILQLDRRSNDLEVIRRQYRKLALLLHPDKNQSPFSYHAFQFVCDAWAFLNDSNKKSLYDNEFNIFMKYDPIVLKNGREKRKTAKAAAAAADEVASKSRLSTFWTLCPYCFYLYEYPGVYEDCCLRCQKCRRSFHAVVLPSPPPAIGHGKEMYYCCWAVFPIGYTTPENLDKNPNWSPFNSTFKGKEVGDDVHEDDYRGGKKYRTESVRIDTEKENEGSGEKIQNVDEPDIVAQQKTLRTKTTARKSVPLYPKPSSKLVVEASSMINGRKSVSDLVGMDLDVNMPNKGVQVESGDSNVEPQKTLRTKTTARKSIPPPKPNNKPAVQASDVINGGKSDSKCVDIESGMNMPNKGVQVGSEANNEEQQKSVRIRTTARKSVPAKPQPVVEATDEINREKSNSCLKLGVNPSAELPKVTDTVEGWGVESLYSEAPEGTGFFEGLDDILGNLPMLAVPGDQKAQSSR